MAGGVDFLPVLAEAALFALTVAVVYGAAYGVSAFWFGIVRRADRVTRARRQLPVAWSLFNTYLVGGLLLDGALPTAAKALFLATTLMLGLTVPVWVWTRLRGRKAPRPATAALLLAWAAPWGVAWAAQWVLA